MRSRRNRTTTHVGFTAADWTHKNELFFVRYFSSIHTFRLHHLYQQTKSYCSAHCKPLYTVSRVRMTGRFSGAYPPRSSTKDTAPERSRRRSRTGEFALKYRTSASRACLETFKLPHVSASRCPLTAVTYATGARGRLLDSTGKKRPLKLFENVWVSSALKLLRAFIVADVFRPFKSLLRLSDRAVRAFY